MGNIVGDDAHIVPSNSLAQSLLGDNYREVDLTDNAVVNVGDDDLGVPNMNTYSTNTTTNSTARTLYTFQCDGIGNITSVGNAVNLNWNGRRLESISQGGTEVVSYKYNIDGQRISKTAPDLVTGEAVTTEYFYNGDILAGQKTGDNVLVFMYDNNGDVFGFTYNGTPYYYVKNAQNDVFLILDETGMIQVLYQYDSWGKVTACYDATDFGLAAINPIMYRSYYVDLEMGFFMYYLNSRYYMADWGRFISADSVTDAGAEELGYNLFVYAANNPVNNSDPSGNWIIKDAIKWVVEKIALPINEKAREMAKKSKNITRAVGINLSAASGVAGAGSIALTTDNRGNIGVMKTNCVGAGTISASASLFKTTTNAPNIYEQNGNSAQIGGSGTIGGLSVGAEYVVFHNLESKKRYDGETVLIGVSAPSSPIEIHAEFANSTVYGINIYDEIENLYIKILEW